MLAAACTIGGARSWIERRRGQRRDLFVAQLPDVARLLANGASAGLSLPAAIQLAARELDDPAGTEMRSVVEQLRVGQPVDDALEGLRERLPSRELGVLMTTLVIQQRAGGDTVRALNELGHTLEARKDLPREIRTLLSGSVFTRWLVAGIGVVTILLLNVISPGVMREMTTSVVGLGAIAVAGTLWTVAFFLIRRDDAGGAMTPALAGALVALCLCVGLLGVPLVLDRGPLDRLAGRTGARGAAAPLARRARRRAAWPPGWARAWRRRSASRSARRSRAGSTSPAARPTSRSSG